MTSVTTWLITGASRGIGLELIKQLLASPENVVVAACRTPERAKALHALKDNAKGTLHVIQLDVSDVGSIRAASAALERVVGTTGLDYLINNAGIMIVDEPYTMDPETLLSHFRTNTVGPLVVSQVALPFLENGRTKKIIHITSSVGSIASADYFGGSFAGYAMSKTALNMLAYKQKLSRPDITVLAVCPGWVKTDMGTQNAEVEPEDSVAGILKVITAATPADSGRYVRYNGETIPW
ncbi:NAD-P-binding protein [Trametes polyzona]|nr:NAD-P-binding protein [Trametes polyzona]